MSDPEDKSTDDGASKEQGNDGTDSADSSNDGTGVGGDQG